jgi:hypothetical protein
MPGGNVDYENDGDESDDRDAIPTMCQRRQPATEPERFHLGTCDVDGSEGEDGDHADVDVDEEEESLPVDDGSTQNVEGCLGSQ